MKPKIAAALCVACVLVAPPMAHAKKLCFENPDGDMFVVNKIKLKKLRRGTTYKLTLTVTSADGQEATDTAKLKVKKKG